MFVDGEQRVGFVWNEQLFVSHSLTEKAGTERVQ